MIGRFAPSTTGEAHPGTLLAALLAWLDVRAGGGDGRVVLRLEDLDPARVRAEWATQMQDALAWLGLDWDDVVVQSGRGDDHAAALDELAATGRLYACACSRALRTRPAPDGGFAYENTCRARVVSDWRACTEPLRARLDDDRVELVDDLGIELSQTPARELGDPVVRRRDGAIAYQLAVVVDDAAAGVTDVVRGRDIAPSTATQILLQRALALPTPRYRHHFLLLEPGREDKLSKLHGAIPYREVRARYRGDELCGVLARIAGLGDGSPTTPTALAASFAWSRVRRDDVVVRWDAARGLVIGD